MVQRSQLYIISKDLTWGILKTIWSKEFPSLFFRLFFFVDIFIIGYNNDFSQNIFDLIGIFIVVAPFYHLVYTSLLYTSSRFGIRDLPQQLIVVSVDMTNVRSYSEVYPSNKGLICCSSNPGFALGMISRLKHLWSKTLPSGTLD